MLKIKKITDAPGDWAYFTKKPITIIATAVMEAFEVETKEGIMKGKKGDFLIKGIKGELYPCDADIFIKTYDDAEDY